MFDKIVFRGVFGFLGFRQGVVLECLWVGIWVGVGEWAMLVPALYWNCVVIFGAYLEPIRGSMLKPIEGLPASTY